MKLHCYTLLLITVSFSNILQAQSSKPHIGKEPAWITKNTINYKNTSLDDDAENGYINLDYECQVLLADACVYTRKSIKILSEAGVQNKSQVSVSFDPGYQQLTFHSINVIRDGAVINQLQLSKIKIVQQETDLDNFIYNGTLNALLFLEDVRKGDIIEYSYSLKGFNPVFGGKYADVLGTGFPSPVYNIYYKIVVPKNRTLNIKNTLDTITPFVQATNDATTYEWKKSDIKALHTQDDLPSWYEPYPDIMVSEYKNWKEINDWALTLFPMNVSLPAAVQKKITEIQKQFITPESRIKAALQFVQDDIRYLGIEMGEHSHKPANPGKVFTQRFGDCKEKTYLLCCMLAAMDIEANPVLINTTYKNSITNWLPSAFAFDHATVRVTLGNSYYYFDPTIAYQRGDIKDIAYPDYQCGLVITDTTTMLTSIPYRKTGDVNVKEIFTVRDMHGTAKLSVTTIFRGSYADDVRNDFKNNSKYEMQKTYQQFYADYFEKIKADSLSYTDDDSTGLFTTSEYYSIDSFWSVTKSTKKASFAPYVIENILYKPKEQQRTMPFYLKFPVKYHEEVEINLPEEWDAKDDEKNIRNNSFTFHIKFSHAHKKIFLQYDFENLTSYVTPQDANTFFAGVKECDENMGYELTYNEKLQVTNVANATNTNSSKIFSILLGTILLVFSIVKIRQGK